MKTSPIQFLKGTGLRRGSVFGGMLIGALLFFEIFNYSTTDFALTDLLGGDLRFLGIRWATILSIAFCGIDFAGIARLFTPEQGRDEPAEVWYLFGAWVLAASMNAALTWWGVAVAINGHTSLGTALIGRETLTKVVPVFVALMVWLIRILIIGTISVAGERIFSMDDTRAGSRPAAATRYERPASQPAQAPAARPLARPEPTRTVNRPDPTYHPVGMAVKPREEAQKKWDS
jgi:hypothetical protein